MVVDLVRGELLVPGRPAASLARRRVLGPLLVAIGRAPAAGVSVDALASSVWSRSATASTRTAIKVAVSRLRTLLGPLSTALSAQRVEGATGYRWDASRAALLVVEGVRPAS